MSFSRHEGGAGKQRGGSLAVGDTPLDLQAGTNAGLYGVIGVLSGASTEATLRREPHTHILSSVASLPALLASKF
jgi:phosphoglycolate phosphatase-like HAD superfamily hydrolase